MKTLLKIFVLEDEWIQQSRIESVLQELIAQKSLQCKAPEVFGKSSQLLDAITERGAHHLFFLDIEIKGEEKKGLEIAKEIRKKDPHATIVFVTTATIVFVTTHSEFMPITFQYKVAALDFIDKTLSEEEFRERIDSAIDYTLEQAGTTIAQDAFTFESAMARVQVPFNKILYVETSPTIHKVILHTQDERLEFYASIADIEKADPRLYRCHRSFVVNPQNITKIDKEDKKAFFENGDNCLISRTKYRGLLEALKK